jgi:hypothetical protein
MPSRLANDLSSRPIKSIQQVVLHRVCNLCAFAFYNYCIKDEPAQFPKSATTCVEQALTNSCRLCHGSSDLSSDLSFGSSSPGGSSPRYSSVKSRRIRFQRRRVGRSSADASSFPRLVSTNGDSFPSERTLIVCHTDGKGYGITCSTLTPLSMNCRNHQLQPQRTPHPDSQAPDRPLSSPETIAD